MFARKVMRPNRRVTLHRLDNAKLRQLLDSETLGYKAQRILDARARTDGFITNS